MDGDIIKYRCVISGVDGDATCANTKWNKSAECKGKEKVKEDEKDMFKFLLSPP